MTNPAVKFVRGRCPHHEKPGKCVICALASLRRNLDQVRLAVTRQQDRGAGNSGFVKGGAPSWEPISLGAYALLQDIRKAGGLNRVEHHLNTLTDPAALGALQRQVRQWASRAQLLLGQALAPYPLMWDSPPYVTVRRNRWAWATRSVPVTCPVVSDTGECGAPLRVHRDNDPASDTFGRAKTVLCVRHDDDHDWTGASQWMRLGILLGGHL